VVKDALPNKGARVTAQLSLPGRYAVLLPGSDGIGISRRLDEENERERLSEILESQRPEGAGLIARTAAAGRSASEIHRDIEGLERRWREIEGSAKRKSSPELVYRELDLPLRFIRDQAISNLEEIVVDGRETFDRLAAYLDDLEPDLRRRLSFFDKPESLFEEAGVEDTIRRALRSRVWLPSGGYVVINPTEALVAIDVNTGRYTSSEDIESTALKVNAEAAVAIASQIRLRDLSGIIVVDFIDMERAENRNEVLAVFSEALEKDRTKVQISSMSQLGLVELTRKRSHTDLSRRLTEPCPCCDGRGRVRAAKTVCLALRRSLIRFCGTQPDRSFHVRSHSRIITTLEGELSALREEIEATIGAPLDLRHDPDLGPDEYEIVAD
jgi:ribonuclease G